MEDDTPIRRSSSFSKWETIVSVISNQDTVHYFDYNQQLLKPEPNEGPQS